MECKKCRCRMVLHAFSDGNCENCNKEIVCGQTPCDSLCEECSSELSECHFCRIKL